MVRDVNILNTLVITKFSSVGNQISLICIMALAKWNNFSSQ